MDEKTAYLGRMLRSYFMKANQQFPALMIVGPRQIGKTTFLKNSCEEGREFVTLDEPAARDLAKTDPALFLKRFKPPVLIDEIQYAPELLPYIKMMIDQNRQPGMFWLTGSQQFHLMQGVSESLAGRVGVMRLLGFSGAELRAEYPESPLLPTENYLDSTRKFRKTPAAEIFPKIWLGSFPELYKAESPDWHLFYSSYVQTYLQRDVKMLANVGNELTFLKFLRICAARTAQLLNLSDLCRDADIAFNTAKHWLSVLESSGIIYLMEPFHSNINKRLVKTPKLYFLDTGLAAYLTQWTSVQTLEAGAMAGAFFETWVVGELLKSWWHRGFTPPLYYYRDKDKKEIDVLIYQDHTVYPIEIKMSASPDRKSIKHFSVLDNLKIPDLKIGEGAVICLADIRLPITETVQAVPAGMI